MTAFARNGRSARLWPGVKHPAAMPRLIAFILDLYSKFGGGKAFFNFAWYPVLFSFHKLIFNKGRSPVTNSAVSTTDKASFSHYPDHLARRDNRAASK
jgi:hypothetical protein